MLRAANREPKPGGMKMATRSTSASMTAAFERGRFGAGTPTENYGTRAKRTTGCRKTPWSIGIPAAGCKAWRFSATASEYITRLSIPQPWRPWTRSPRGAGRTRCRLSFARMGFRSGAVGFGPLWNLFWILPKKMLNRPNRAVILLRIGRAGDLRSTVWTEKSPSAAFNQLAAKALERIKRYPVFPPTVPDSVLEIQYEFVTYGKSGPRHRLFLKGSPPPNAGVESASTSG